jgi:hypothetical protein
MAQTKAGAAKARDAHLTNDPDYYKKLARLGGIAPHTKPQGFATLTPEQHKEYSSKGGRNAKQNRDKPA